MILCVDIGNTKTDYGFYVNGSLKHFVSVNTNKFSTGKKLYKSFIELLGKFNIDIKNAEYIVVSCVVSHLNDVIKKTIDSINAEYNLKINLLFLNYNSVSKSDSNIFTTDIDDPLSIGPDFIAAVIGAKKISKKSFIVVDMGTATNLSIVDDRGVFCGAIIMPGVETGMRSLLNSADALLSFSVEQPKMVCAKNTHDALNSGFVFGEASKIDGVIDKIMIEKKQKFQIYTTGGWSKLISKNMNHNCVNNRHLLLDGLYNFYYKVIVESGSATTQ